MVFDEYQLFHMIVLTLKILLFMSRVNLIYPETSFVSVLCKSVFEENQIKE
jgi:hypothetical protein